MAGARLRNARRRAEIGAGVASVRENPARVVNAATVPVSVTANSRGTDGIPASQTTARNESRRGLPGGNADLACAATVMLAAAVAALALPQGSRVRAAITLPILLGVPGYLLLQAIVVPARSGRRRAFHLAIGTGLGIPIVALASLATAMLPGGFVLPAIVVSVTVACLMLAVIAWARRRRFAEPSPADERGPAVRASRRWLHRGNPGEPPWRDPARGATPMQGDVGDIVSNRD